jgi:hypothetical protein
MNRRPGSVEQASAVINACCWRKEHGGAQFVPCPRIAGGIDSNRDPRSREPGSDVGRPASVSGMRAVLGAATGQGGHLAGQIVNPLQQVSGVGGLGD